MKILDCPSLLKLKFHIVKKIKAVYKQGEF